MSCRLLYKGEKKLLEAYPTFNLLALLAGARIFLSRVKRKWKFALFDNASSLILLQFVEFNLFELINLIWKSFLDQTIANPVKQKKR